jgi:hypothetical protein
LDGKIDFAAEVAGDGAERYANESRDEDHGEGDQERHAGAMNDAAENVPPQVVGAKNMNRTDALRRFHHGSELLFVGVGGRERWTENPHSDEEQYDDTAAKRFHMQARQYARAHGSPLFSSGFEGQRLHRVRR